jgi:hypothetical protein
MFAYQRPLNSDKRQWEHYDSLYFLQWSCILPLHMVIYTKYSHIHFQVILECVDKGVREGRHQVHAWLSLLAARYNQVLSSDVRTPLSSIDIDFSQCPQLQTIPQLVFALLRSPLLRLHEEGVHPDYRIYLQCLFRFVLFLFRYVLVCSISCEQFSLC